MASIHAKEYPISEVFSNAFAFTMPPYQRPYSWEIEHTSALFNDLMVASEGYNPSDTKRVPSPYFLGSVVLVKPGEKTADAAVIDGQQRLTTLALLLSSLRVSFADPKRKAKFGQFLLEEGDILVGTQDRCRLILRDKDHAFFENNILKHATLDNLESLLKQHLPDPQKHLAENGRFLVGATANLTQDRRESFAAFLLQHTYLVIVTTPDLESAFRIFSVLNDRGLDLSIADILKAEIVGSIAETEQETYVERWEDAENSLGTSRFAELFSHIRMIHGREKLRKSVLEGFRAAVKATSQPKMFIDNELLPACEAFRSIIAKEYDCADTKQAVPVNRSLLFLARIADNDWVPAAILYLQKNKEKPELLTTFLVELERLATIMWLCRKSENERIERYGRLITEIQDGKDWMSAGSSMQLSADEKKEATEVLDGNIYELNPKPKRTMILLRLDQELRSAEASYDVERITVEHVLPQSPAAESEWMKWWPDEAHRVNSVHRLGNLALLNRRQNSAAKNWDLKTKKDKYFRGKSGSSPFSLTNEILEKTEWTPLIFAERQQRFLSKLKTIWRLA